MQPDTLEFWIDLNLPPKMANWINDEFGIKAFSFKDLDFMDMPGVQVYKIAAAKSNTIIITTKDVDFINYQNLVGAPPRILYLNVGNISNQDFERINTS